jgi:hypothetical protein
MSDRTAFLIFGLLSLPFAALVIYIARIAFKAAIYLESLQF